MNTEFNNAFTNIGCTEADKIALDKNKKHNCAAFGPTGSFKRYNPDGSFEFKRAPCNRWPCSECAPRQIKRLNEEVYREVVKHGLMQHLTLTLRYSNPPNASRDAKKLTDKWASFCDAYRKRARESLTRIAFKQIEDGHPHLHIFCRDLDKAWVKKKWCRRTGAYQVKLQPIDPDTLLKLIEYATRQIHDNARQYGKTCGHWRFNSQDVEIDVRRRGSGNGWDFQTGRVYLSKYQDHEIQYVDIDRRTGQPTHVKITPKTKASHEN